MKIRKNTKNKTLTFVFPQKKFYNKASKLYKASSTDKKAVQNYLNSVDSESYQILFKYGYPKSYIERIKEEKGIDLPEYGYTSLVIDSDEFQNTSNVLMEFIGNELIDYADQKEQEEGYDFAFDISQVIVRPLADKIDPLANLNL